MVKVYFAEVVNGGVDGICLDVLHFFGYARHNRGK
jgi:hypothetical protein